MDVPFWAWLAVLGVILAMLFLDLFLHRDAHVISVREAATWSAIWVAFGVAFGALIWRIYGAEYGQQYFAGYLIEKSLAVDNVFVWAIIFAFFAVPREYQHRVLFYGVLGALVFRAAFIAGGSALIASFSWILYLFAAFLLVTGVKMLMQRDAHIDPAQSRTLALLRRVVPMIGEYRGQRFWIRRNGVLVATPLLAVLVLVEVTDIIFAVDSIPAIFAVTDEVFLVFTANAFAILGLRAMYFLLADLIHRFVYLKAGLALVLIWVGIKMLLKIDVVYIPTTISLAVVTTIIGTSIALSLRKTRGQARHLPEVETAQPFRVRDEDGGMLAGHESEYGDDTPAEIVGGTRRQRERLGLDPMTSTSSPGATS
ncbi:TerC family protein [Nocardioides sp.]|uniref:TerC family protein n=1 Tax=Nocardioides sp. TaxID=35761 RepID=UPI00351608E9